MMSSRPGVSLSQENKLWISWHDTTWIPILNPSNIMEYFSQKSNPFYDRTCNNENIRMQRLALDQLTNLVGVEYILLHVAEPILYVIRKQHRHSPSEATPLADYYIIAGIVYQAPDLANVFNSRILSTVTNLESAFEEASSYSRYHANKGYAWDFVSNKSLSDKLKAASNKDNMSQNKEESASIFQCQRVDMLLVDLLGKFPPRLPLHLTQQTAAQSLLVPREELTHDQGAVKQELVEAAGSNNNPNAISPNSNISADIKFEPCEMKPPPDKKFKI